MQKEIVAEIEGYQNEIDANRELISRFEKNIEGVVDRVWGIIKSQK